MWSQIRPDGLGVSPRMLLVFVSELEFRRGEILIYLQKNFFFLNGSTAERA